MVVNLYNKIKLSLILSRMSLFVALKYDRNRARLRHQFSFFKQLQIII